MNNQPIPTCFEHQATKQWTTTTFEYDEDGIVVRVPNVPAWVCPIDGEPSFTPETVDALIETVRDLIELAKRARARPRRPLFAEYVVSVGEAVAV